MQKKVLWLTTGVVATIVGALLVGFDARAVPQPQRVSDLVARIEALEEENGAQQELLDELSARLDAVEATGGGSGIPALAEDVEIPEAWTDEVSSDGIVRYWRDRGWELTNDEPGTMDIWLDEDNAIFFSWDWGADLVTDLHDDDDYFRLFEDDLVWSDDTIRMTTEASGALEFMGAEAHYWEISVENLEGFSSRMLTIFYTCSDRASCSVTLARFDPDPEDDEAVAPFGREDWDFVNLFANSVEFLNEDEATVTANANVRACPQIGCEIVGRLLRGEIIELVAVTEDGQWLQLESGEWISSSMVYNAPLDLPIVQNNEDI